MAKKKLSTAAEVGIGLATGAAAAALAGVYYLYGTKAGAKQRVKIKGWMLKAKGEVLEQMEKMKKIDEKTYHAVVEGVTKQYKKIKRIDPKEVVALANDLKRHWKNIEAQIKKVKKGAKRVAKKSKKGGPKRRK